MKQLATSRNYFILMIIAYSLFAFYFYRGSSSKALLLGAFGVAILAMILMAIKGDSSEIESAGI